MEALKDEVPDQCRRCQPAIRLAGQLNLLDGGAAIASISLPCRTKTTFGKPINLRPEWLGYRSKEQSKTPNIGVSADAGRTPPS